MIRYYEAYGLTIQADIDFFELVELEDFSGEADVSVLEGVGPSELKDPIKSNGSFQTTVTELLWNKAPLFMAYIKEGRQIVYKAYSNVEIDRFRSYLLNMGLCVILIQRDILPVHCCTIKDDKGATVIMGRSGAGKTSLGTYFYQKNARLMTDDVLPIYNTPEGYRVRGSFPTMRLRQDTVDLLGLDSSGLRQIKNSKFQDKYYIDLKEQFDGTLTNINKIIEIQPDPNCKAPYLEEIHGATKIAILTDNVFGQGFLYGFGKGLFLDEVVKGIVNSVPFYRLYRPEEGLTVAEQYELINEM